MGGHGEAADVNAAGVHNDVFWNGGGKGVYLSGEVNIVLVEGAGGFRILSPFKEVGVVSIYSNGGEENYGKSKEKTALAGENGFKMFINIDTA